MVPEMFRAITRTVLLLHTCASIAKNRLDVASYALAMSPRPRSPFNVISISAVAA